MALFEFVSSNPQELAFAAGDVLTVDNPDPNKAWWLLTASYGDKGFGPANHLRLNSGPDHKHSPSRAGKPAAGRGAPHMHPHVGLAADLERELLILRAVAADEDGDALRRDKLAT